MSLFRRFSGNEKIDCPRCLGKGHVDWDDINRLKQALKWVPGTCAYCNGEGTISPDLEDKLAADTTYLTIDLEPEERIRLITNDEGALQRAIHYEMYTDNFITEIEFLHFKGNMDSDTIAEFYFLHQPEAKPEEKAEFVDYVNRVIEQKNKE